MSNLNAVDFSASLNSIANASSMSAQSQLQAKTTTGTATGGMTGQSVEQVKAKAKQASENFESMFLSSMFQQMYAGLDGDGPFGGKGSLKIWRSFMTDQIAKSFAKTGGIGLAPQVYAALLRHQGISAS
jgi:Rod binding domain-containing protein